MRIHTSISTPTHTQREGNLYKYPDCGTTTHQEISTRYRHTQCKAAKMPNSKSILKILFALGVWSFVVIGLFKIHSNNIILEDYPQAPMNGRLLLQKDLKFNFEATSTTTDRILPVDVLVDSRQGEQILLFIFSLYTLTVFGVFCGFLVRNRFV